MHFFSWKIEIDLNDTNNPKGYQEVVLYKKITEQTLTKTQVCNIIKTTGKQTFDKVDSDIIRNDHENPDRPSSLKISRLPNINAYKVDLPSLAKQIKRLSIKNGIKWEWENEGEITASPWNNSGFRYEVEVDINKFSNRQSLFCLSQPNEQWLAMSTVQNGQGQDRKLHFQITDYSGFQIAGVGIQPFRNVQEGSIFSAYLDSENGKNFRFEMDYNAVALGSLPVDKPAFKFKGHDAVLYIGCGPNGKKGFDGVIKRVLIDPPHHCGGCAF